MTPDERLREAVGEHLRSMMALDLKLTQRHLENAIKSARKLAFVYEEDPRPCINAAVKVEKDRSWFGWFQRWRKKR